MDKRTTDIWNRWKQRYPISRKEHAILDAYMDEYYYRLSIPPVSKIPGWASEDYDGASRLISGWDYNRG